MDVLGQKEGDLNQGGKKKFIINMLEPIEG